MSEVEVWLDETPGETRGIVAVDGRFTHLLIDREDAAPAHRLGACSVGRVAHVAAGLNGAFVELAADGPEGFLPARDARVGERIEVEVVAEPRESKGPTLRRTGVGEGAPRLIRPAPTVAERLTVMAPGVEPVTGAPAIRAAIEAEEEALSDGVLVPDAGLDVAVQRTRALIAVDLDLAPDAAPGVRSRANRRGLKEAARLIGLKSWGGLVVVDLIGARHGPTALDDARAAFSGPDVAFGPVSRFGLLQLTTPWRHTPLEDQLNGPDGRRIPLRRAIAAVRALRLALFDDAGAARLVLKLPEPEATLAAPLVARLGPRAALVGDANLGTGAHMIARP
jgi:Ribonuclease G/E